MALKAMGYNIDYAGNTVNYLLGSKWGKSGKEQNIPEKSSCE